METWKWQKPKDNCQPVDLIKLRDFFVFNGKLLYGRKEFIGYDPVMSPGFTHEKVKSGIISKIEEFEMNGCSFKAIMTFFIDYGPLRGYKRVEILKAGVTIICHEIGGLGFGTNYSKGNDYYISGSDAFFVSNGYSMMDLDTHQIFSDYPGEAYYLFWFKNIVIPVNYEKKKLELPDKEIYLAMEIEPLRQVVWDATIDIDGNRYLLEQSCVFDFFQTRWNKNGGEFCKTRHWWTLSKTKMLRLDAGPGGSKMFRFLFPHAFVGS